MFVDIAGRFFRSLPFFKGKNFISRIFLAPFVKGKGYEVTVKLLNEGNIRLLCNIDDWIPWNVYIHGRYQIEKRYESFMLGAARGSSVIFDVGANIGYYTTQFSRLLGDNGAVYAFEPCNYQHDILSQNLLLNDLRNVTVTKAIVSDVQGSPKKVFFSGISNTGSSSVEIESDHFEVVETVTVDDFCHNKEIDAIDLMKIDVEGHELSVLKGMKRILAESRLRNLFVEINEETLTAAGTSAQEVVDFLAGFGYVPASIVSGQIAAYQVGASESLVYFRKLS